MEEEKQIDEEEFVEEEFVEEKKKKERKLVIPGETIVSGDNFLPGDFTRKEGTDIIATRYGLAEENGRIVKIIPISGVFEPRNGNTVIGRVEDITFNGWIIDLGAPYSSFLSLMECPRFINKNEIQEFADIGDIMNLKIGNVKRGGIDLTLKSRGLGKLNGGRVIKINSHKVPRVIGKEGNMINLIKNETNTEIIVGQNGYIWIKGNLEGEKKAEEAINLVAEEAVSIGLTEKIEKFLKEK